MHSIVVAVLLASCHRNAPVDAAAPTTSNDEKSPADHEVKAAEPEHDEQSLADAKGVPRPRTSAVGEPHAPDESDPFARDAGDPDSKPPREDPRPPPSNDPATFSRRIDEDWSSFGCPSKQPCLAPMDFVAVVAKSGWDHSWVLEYRGKKSAIRAGAADDVAYGRRFAEGVRHVMALEKLTVLEASCGFIEFMPEAFGHTAAGVEVTVPKGRRGKVPKAITPAEANAALVTAYEKIGYPMDPDRPPRVFTDEELARMNGAGFETPKVRRAGAWLGGRTGNSEALLHFIYSPTGNTVYLLDTSYQDIDAAAVAKRTLKTEAQLADLLRGLKLATVAFDLSAACSIPKALGGRAWLPFELTPRK